MQDMQATQGAAGERVPERGEDEPSRHLERLRSLEERAEGSTSCLITRADAGVRSVPDSGIVESIKAALELAQGPELTVEDKMQDIERYGAKPTLNSITKSYQLEIDKVINALPPSFPRCYSLAFNTFNGILVYERIRRQRVERSMILRRPLLHSEERYLPVLRADFSLAKDNPNTGLDASLLFLEPVALRIFGPVVKKLHERFKSSFRNYAVYYEYDSHNCLPADGIQTF